MSQSAEKLDFKLCILLAQSQSNLTESVLTCFLSVIKLLRASFVLTAAVFLCLRFVAHSLQEKDELHVHGLRKQVHR